MLGYTLIKKDELDSLNTNTSTLKSLRISNRENIRMRHYWENAHSKLLSTIETERCQRLKILQNLIKYQKSKGISYKFMAGELNLHPSYISLVITWKYKPKIKYINKFIDKLLCK